MIIIILFILILNVVSILLMYRCLVNSDKKEKLIFIAAGTALMYILTSIVYWISTRGIEMTEVSQTGKDLIIFAFVPVNGIIILPLFAKSFTKFKDGKISGIVLRNRGILLGLVLVVLLVLECIYFKNIQEQVVNYITEKTRIQKEQEIEAQGQNNEIINGIYTNSLDNSKDVIDVDTINGLDNENLTHANSNNDMKNFVDEPLESNIVNVVINQIE